jgi:hypothetical protein
MPMLVQAARAKAGLLQRSRKQDKRTRRKEMRKTSTLALSGIAVAGVLALSPIAQAAEPITLTTDQMDTVTAGDASLLVGFLVTFTPPHSGSLKIASFEVEAKGVEFTVAGPGPI